MDTKKRQRSSNFTAAEMEVLLALVEEHIKVVECKKTDAISNRDKDTEWRNIMQKFNASVGSDRTIKQLRNKWDSWKKLARKNYSLNKINLCKTGNGLYNNCFDNWEKRVLSLIGISATGEDYPYDSDNIGSETSFDIIKTELPSPKLTDDVKVDYNNPLTIDQTMCTYQLPVKPTQIQQSDTIKDSLQEIDENKWNENDTGKQWNPTQLRTPIPFVLTEELLPSTDTCTVSKQTDSVPKFQKRKYKHKVPGTANSKHNLLLDKKLELVSLQIELLKKEHDMREKRNAEKHELEMLLLKDKCICSKDT